MQHTKMDTWHPKLKKITKRKNVAKRRRVLLNVEVTSESEEDHTSRSARTDLTFWPGRESMVATSPSRHKFIQGSSSQIQDVPMRNLGRHIHPDASVEKEGALHGVESSNEDEDGGSRNVKPCLKRAVERAILEFAAPIPQLPSSFAAGPTAAECGGGEGQRLTCHLPV